MKIQFYQHQIDKLVNHLKTELDYDVYPMTRKRKNQRKKMIKRKILTLMMMRMKNLNYS